MISTTGQPRTANKFPDLSTKGHPQYGMPFLLAKRLVV